MKMEHTECSKLSAYEIQTLGNYAEENIQHTEHGKSFEIRNIFLLLSGKLNGLHGGSVALLTQSCVVVVVLIG
jgi:hypothetical protein